MPCCRIYEMESPKSRNHGQSGGRQFGAAICVCGLGFVQKYQTPIIATAATRTITIISGEANPRRVISLSIPKRFHAEQIDNCGRAPNATKSTLRRSRSCPLMYRQHPRALSVLWGRSQDRETAFLKKPICIPPMRKSFG